MKRRDYASLISHYIPHEKKYHFIFPIPILNKYNGPSNLDVTLDDHLTYYIIEPLLKNQIEYHFEIIWKDDENSLDICVRVNDKKFDHSLVIDNLVKQQMITSLELYKEEYGKLIKIYTKS